MADPKSPQEPFNVRGNAEHARLAEKVKRSEARFHAWQEQVRPTRIARAEEALHKQQRPVREGPPPPVPLPDRIAVLKQEARHQVEGKEASEQARFDGRKQRMFDKAGLRQTKTSDRAQPGEHGRANLEKKEQAARERPSTVQEKLERAKQQRQERSIKRDFNRVRE